MNENNISKTQRNSSIELLRIISMVMIVSSHFATHGGFLFDVTTLSIPRFWLNFLQMGGDLGVDVFVLISGYFLIKSNGIRFTFNRILKFWGQVIFYSISIFLIFGLLGVVEWRGITLISACFPITFSTWWFVSTYFVLYVIHPFLNMFLQKLDKVTYQKLLVMMLILWCIIPTFTASSFQGNNLMWFITLYCIAGYVSLYGLNTSFSRKHYILMWLLFSFLRYMSCIALTLIGTRISFVAEHTLFFYKRNSLLTFLSALALFMLFEKTRINYSRFINSIASATFGVYLIHDNWMVRSFLWQRLFNNARYQDTIMVIPYSLIVVLLVYVACTIIDLIRQKVFEKPYMFVVNKYSKLWLKPFEKMCDICRGWMFGK